MITKILQIKRGNEFNSYSFSSLRLLKNLGLSVNINNYNVVYETTEWDEDYDNVYELLETIYMKYQGIKPEGYKGHSLSVSDIVMLDNEYWFCDDFGFKNITNII